MIVELVVMCEVTDAGIQRIGLKPTAQAPWVIVMILEALIRQLEMQMEAEFARRVTSAPVLDLGKLRAD